MNLATDASSNPKGDEQQTDAIADLLVGNTTEDEATDDSTGEQDALTEESTALDESEESESEESEEQSEEEEGKAEETGDVTWEGVLGIPEDQLVLDDDGNISAIKVKVNGETTDVPMKDLVAGYQLNKVVTQKSQALTDERNQFEAQRNEAVQVMEAKLSENMMLGEYLEQQLIGEYDKVDWDQLRTTNPAEYSAARQDYAARAQSIKDVKASVENSLVQLRQEAFQRQQAAEATFVREQYGKMIENNPTWSDERIYERDMGALRDFCSDTYGFGDSDFALVKDARLISLIQDAQKYRAGAALGKEKMSKPVPTFRQGKGRQDSKPKPSKLKSLTEAAKKAKGSDARRDLQTEAVATILTGGR